MISNEELLENYAKGLASEGKTRSLYLRFAKEFLAFAHGDFSRAKINAYVEQLRTKRNYSDGSVNFAFRVVRTLHVRNQEELKKEGFEWPFRRGESPQIREDQIQAPALHPTTVGRMIGAVRKARQPAEMAFLALSTTYGLRRTEMVELTAKDVRLKDQTIHIATAKHGRERTHLIPDAIIPALSGHDFAAVRSENYVFTLWYQIEHKIGMFHTDQVGWHSVRRSLNTMLIRVLPDGLRVGIGERRRERRGEPHRFHQPATSLPSP